MLCLIIRYFIDDEIILGFECCNCVFLIQLMLFIESIRIREIKFWMTYWVTNYLIILLELR